MKLRSSIFDRSILLLLVFVISTLAAFAQTALPYQSKHDETAFKSEDIGDATISGELKPGIVVEKIEKDSVAERANLQEKDILLRWSRGEASGEFQSPFDLFSLTIEETPLGPVTLEGMRGTDKRVWVLQPTINAGIEARPNFSDNLLSLYRDCEQLVRAEQVKQATENWRVIVTNLQNRSNSWLSTWFILGSASYFSGGKRWKEADDAFEEAVQTSTETGPLITTYALRLWAKTFEQRQDWTAAEKYYQQASVESEKLGKENLFTAAILSNLGGVNYNGFVDMPEAEHYFKRALATNEKLLPESLAVATNLDRLGFIASFLGNVTQTEEYTQRALAIQQKLAPDSRFATYSLEYLGLAAIQRGDLAKSENYFRQALSIEQRHLFSPLVSFEGLGYIALHREDLSQAEYYFYQAFAIAQKTQDKFRRGEILGRLGEVARSRGNLAKAENYYGQSFKLLQKYDRNSYLLPFALSSLGEIKLNRGDLDGAEKYCFKALKMKEKRKRDPLSIAVSLNDLAEIARKRNELAKATEYYRQALIQEQQAPGTTIHAESLAALARIMRRLQRPDDATTLYEQAQNVLESQTARLGGSAETRAQFRAKYTNYYKDYVDLLITEQKPFIAFQVLERLRARSLLESFAGVHADIHKDANYALLQDERLLQEQINAKSNRRMQLLGDKKNARQVAVFDQEIGDLLVKYKDVEEQIKTSSPAYAALTQPQPLSAKAVQQQLLDADTTLLEYSLGEERSYVFAVKSDSLNTYELPKRARIERLAKHTYALLTERNHRIKGESKQQRQIRSAKAEVEYSRALAQLSQMVLAPVAEELQSKRLLIVSDGALQYIPYAILPKPKASNSTKSVPLIAEHEIINLPSASVLAVLRQQQAERKPASKEIAVLADPVFAAKDERVNLAPANSQDAGRKGGAKHPAGHTAVFDIPEESDLDRSAKQLGISGFPRLPFTRREAEAIHSIAGNNDAFEALDFDASKATALSSQLKDYRIVHFATHGLLNNEHPELSGLVFSLVDKQGNEQDGFLRMLDIYNMELNADLVVLSACQTALGKEIGEEGLVGLTRGFMYAGAPRVVASLWKVDDEATAELMKKFYEGMLRDHQTPAQALRGAQQWMRTQKQWQSPYYWAGFVLQGEWK